MRYLTLKPTDEALTLIADLTGQPAQRLRGGTLDHFPAQPVNLTGLNPYHRASYRNAAASNWLMGRSSQTCPACLAETGIWQTHWRLYTTTICHIHHRYLITTCPACQRPPRDVRTRLLRQRGTGPTCQNPQHRRGNHCTYNLANAPTGDRPTQAAIDAQLAHHHLLTTPHSSDELQAAQLRLQLLRSVTCLILHIATATPEQPWEHRVAAAAQERSITRGPRWGIRPIDDPATRTRALTEAWAIITNPHPTRALDTWTRRIQPGPESRRTWIKDHTTYPLTTLTA